MGVRLTTETFILKANKVHQNKYDYSLVDYTDSVTKVKIICPVHSIFEQSPSSHLRGCGCFKCSIENQRMNINDFILKANNIHNDQYDYSLVDYKNSKTKVKIICCIHSIFEQTPNSHLMGCGCPKCGDAVISETCEFIEKAKLVHNNKYDYSKVNYKNAYTKVSIICAKHGIFEQTPNSHLTGHGCPVCAKFISKSKGERELCQYIKSIYSGEILENTRDYLDGKELDVYLPELKLAFEYNGEYWHQLKEEKEPGYHKLKSDLCKINGIRLININDEDWRKQKEKVKENILKLMSYNIINFEFGDLSGDGHEETEMAWLKTDLTKEEFEECLDSIKSELGFDFDDNIFCLSEDDTIPWELTDYLKENKFEFIENILQGFDQERSDKIHFSIEFFISLIIFLVKQVYEKRHPGQTILLEETTNPLPKVSRFWGYGLFTWG